MPAKAAWTIDRLPGRRLLMGALAVAGALALAGCEEDGPSPAAVDFGKALTEIEAGDLATAEQLLASALERDPSHAASHAALGRIDEARGRLAAARAHYEAARSVNETSPEGHWQLGRLALERGLLSDALRHCTAAQHLGPTDAAIMTLRSRLMQRVGLLAGAEEVARDALSRRPNDVLASLQLSAVRTAVDGPEAGIETLRAAEASGAAIPPAAMLALFDQLGRPKDAISWLFGRLVDATPEVSRAIVAPLAERLVQAGRSAQAETMLEAHLVEQPRDATALALRARLALAREGEMAARTRIRAGSALAGEPGGDTERQLLSMIDRLIAGEDEEALGSGRLRFAGAMALTGQAAKPLPPVVAENELPLATLETALDEAGEVVPPLLLALVGEARAANGDDAGARKAFDRALADSLGHVQVLEVYARALRAQGEASAATALLADYRAERLGDRRLTALLGAHYNAAGEHEAVAALAEDAFGDAALSGLPDPFAESLLVAAVEGALAAGEPVKARQYTEAATAADPAQATPHILLAAVHRVTGQRLAAVEAARRAIDLMPGRADGYLALARLLAEDDAAAAIDVLDRGITRVADTATLRFDRAVVLERLGDVEAATEEYERLHAIAPGAQVVVNNLASLLAGGPRIDDVDTERLERAAELAERLSGRAIPEFDDTRGWIAVKLGDLDEALPLLERAAAARQEHPVIHYHLGIAYYLAGESRAAADTLRYMLSLDSRSAIEYEDEAARVLAKVERQGGAAGRGVD